MGKDERDKRIEDLEESLSKARQRAAVAEGRMQRMAIALSRDGQTKMADGAAREIEDMFARGGSSRDQRLLNITKTIRRQISIAVSGEPYWND